MTTKAEVKCPRVPELGDPKFKNGDIVTIDYSLVASMGNGNFARGCRDPLKVLYETAPRPGTRHSYIVEDARGVIDLVAEEVLKPA